MKEEFYFQQCVLYRSDIEELGYNSESITDDAMQEICKELEISMCCVYGENWSKDYGNNTMESLWWQQLNKVCDKFEIEKKN